MSITAYKRTALTGGTAGALDQADGAALLNGDLAFTTLSGFVYIHDLDDDSGAGENSPLIIAPDTNPGSKRWIMLQPAFVGDVTPVSADGAALGTTALPWSDLRLASGAVIDFGNDVLITHSANTLTFSGGTNYVFDAPVGPTTIKLQTMVTGGICLYGAAESGAAASPGAGSGYTYVKVNGANLELRFRTNTSDVLIASGGN